MLQSMGATLKLSDLHAAFPLPRNPDHHVCALLDICHVLKLIRNTLAAGWVLHNTSGGKITWTYVQELHKIQEEEGQKRASV